MQTSLLARLLDDHACDRQPSLNDDGLHLYFESDRDHQGESVYVASRSNISSDSSHPVYPILTEDGFTMSYNTSSAGLSTATRGAL